MGLIAKEHSDLSPPARSPSTPHSPMRSRKVHPNADSIDSDVSLSSHSAESVLKKIDDDFEEAERAEELALMDPRGRSASMRRMASPAPSNEEVTSKNKGKGKGKSKSSISPHDQEAESASSGRSSRSKSSSSGFSLNRADVEIVYLSPLDRKYECPVCSQVLRYPVQFEDCGHRCCSACLPQLLRVAPRCPIDQVKIERDRVYVDKAFQKEIDVIGVRCSFHESKCKWQGDLKELMPHIEDCKYAPITCPNNCGVEFQRRFLSRHLDEDCALRGRACAYCKQSMTHDELSQHRNVCESFPVECPNGCKRKDIPRSHLEHHLLKECHKQNVVCPFAEAGCDFKSDRKAMTAHVKEEPEFHLNLVSQVLVNYKSILSRQNEQLDKQDERLAVCETKVNNLEKLYGSQLIWKIDDYDTKMRDATIGRKTTIYSPPFLTSRHGYKLALSACLYGDGKGDYDGILLWPFSHRITFTMIDQSLDVNSRQNVSYTIKPNTCAENKAFLGRPEGERNASFGAQNFVELEVISTMDYVKDNTMFIKVTIDSDDMLFL